jgi:hypothetical protein
MDSQKQLRQAPTPLPAIAAQVKSSSTPPRASTPFLRRNLL